ncbi:MAG: hypothetical protein ABIH37_03635 [archaeon]
MRKNKKSQLKIQGTINHRFLDLGFSKKGQLKIQAHKNSKKFLVPESSKAQLKIQAMTNQRFLKLGFSNKKSQLKIQEMAFMIVAVVLFFALVGLFVLSIVFVNIQDEATRIAEEKTLAAATSLADTPELSCIAAKVNCIDADKLISLVNLNNSQYDKFWPFSSLSVIQLSGFEKEEEDLVECTFANYPDCDIFNVYDKKVDNERAIASFVALCRKDFQNDRTYDKCEVAKIVAGTEFKRIEE